MKRKRDQGRVLTPADPGFVEALLGTSFNAQDPGRRPDLIVQANDEADVIGAVRRARAE